MTEYKIKHLGHLGDGVADGPVFVAGALPGEVVTGELQGERLGNVRIVRPSDDRVSAPCRHYKSCGGCQLQHASNAFVADWKVDIVRKTLRLQGLDVTLKESHVSPPASRRRATLAARRTKKGAMVGFHARGSDTIIEIPDCKLLHPDLMGAFPAFEALAVAGASRKGVLSLSACVSASGLDVNVSGGKPLDGPLRAAIGPLAEAHGLARLCWDGEVIVMRDAPVQNFGPGRVVPPPGAFSQATPQGEEALVSDVLSALENARFAVDLFSGCGTFTFPVSQGCKVHAVEGNADMIAALNQGWRNATGIKEITTERRDLFRNPLVADELRKFDAAIIDPPRAGAEAQVDELAESGISTIAYVSCNPTTFARDARRLISAGYGMDSVRVIDQFRWSTHVELVTAFHLTSE